VKGQQASYASDSVISEEEKRHVAAAFQQAALQDIVSKSLKAAEQLGCRTFIFGGGVCNNKKLRALFEEQGSQYQMFWPSPGLTLDNAAMIAGLGYHKYRSAGEDSLAIEARTSMSWLQKI
jgi:N6-L-threonylcarbamoyladenine synthase